ncbi:MAG: CBS domain-containing protein [Bdellovibrionales bacterium]
MTDPKIKPPTVLVTDIMVTAVFRVTPEMKLWEVAELMMRHLISGAPVVDSMDRVISVIGEGDTLRLSAAHGVEATVASCLDKLPAPEEVVTLQKFDSFTDAYRIFLKHKFHRLPVVDGGGALKGLVTRSTILQLIVEAHHGKKIPKKTS